ncbi:MAG: YidB family protein [Burkholderiaceae bacterium]|nr:YidB family protein [Burkholderiaceae bacterium]
MGLLDSVIGALAGGTSGNAAGTGGGQAALINIVLGMLTNRNGAAAGGGLGGLGDLMAKFQQAGLGEAASSWVSTGQNVPVSPDQVEGALGTDLIAQIARQIGLPQGETAGHLSELLPQVVDRMTPGGQLPEGGVNADELAGFEGLGDLLRRFS